MKQRILITLVIMLCINILPSKAQFFDFSFSTPDAKRQQMQQETVENAKYKGGQSALNKFIEKKFKYISTKSTIDGNIVVTGIINEKGRISEASVIQSLGKELDSEAIRIIKKIKFEPAKQGKTKIKSRIDIYFPIHHGKISFSTLKTMDI